VTASDAQGAPSDFGNGGPGITVGAPGVDLVGPHPGDRWGRWSGTSFATGLASGGAALPLERRPGLLPSQVLQRFVNTARPAPRGLPAATRRLLGAGRLDLLGLAR
jgi:subtilisin family serine protease